MNGISRFRVSISSALGALLLGGWVAMQLAPWLPDAGGASAVVVREVIAPALPPAPPAPDASIGLPGTDASASPRALPLLLVSTSPAQTLADSTATLGTDARNPQTYAGGARLSNGARIVEIHARHIVLDWRGERVVLAVGGAAQLPARLAPALRVGGVPVSPPGTAPETTAPDLARFMRPQPVFEQSRLTGWKVLPGMDASRLTALGLSPGDVIRRVEGRLVTERSWQQIDDALSAQAGISLSVERDGVLTEISLDGAQLAAPTPRT